MLKQFLTVFSISVIALSSCQSGNSSSATADSSVTDSGAVKAESPVAANTKPNDAAAILAKPQVPILCYHQIRNWLPRDGKVGKDYIVEIANFKAQMKMLADSGYHTILPDQLYDYLVYNKELPSKPIMLTFDDTDLDQFTVANPELKKYGFKAVYFIMTVSIGRKGKFLDYMSKEQIKQLADEGNVIGSHTYDHKNFKKYEGEDWVTQIEKPSKKLEEITGKKMEYFAYPFGLWNAEGIPELKKRGFKAAFALAEKRDQKEPLFTIRRIIASGYWSPKTLSNAIRNSF
ncbi:polysaccharide deacetylase family protein [Mucilaginibacter hurinus]|uniref:Polysaccharide deacetylase family protein n=1 Tax=Mucilaginibacter hurinus TaxID=2201324 RepID=A0A367GRG2_9SPHI|nr:polysaccharide deacetylase family protein [Mucilaginibacter hurinus]RCH55850.1 polysaccharide deacetylase family protein [Mucilaginibacter hurinus]